MGSSVSQRATPGHPSAWNGDTWCNVGHYWVSHDTRPGKRLHNYGKSPFFMGKLTINGDLP